MILHIYHVPAYIVICILTNLLAYTERFPITLIDRMIAISYVILTS